MFRRLFFVAAVASLALGACSTAAPAAPALTDPKEILTKSVTTLKDVKTVHMHADVSGQIKMDLSGTGNAAALDLKGTTADADIDIPNKKAHLTFSAPALLGVTVKFAVAVTFTTWLLAAVVVTTLGPVQA